MENEFNSCISSNVSAAELRKIYLKLEDENTPHAIRVKNLRPGVRCITIYADVANVPHFKDIIANLDDEH